MLLYGPPGTGKTLLARAVAGEADVPFFSISASEFVEAIVGVGASRVRDLFKQAKEARRRSSSSTSSTRSAARAAAARGISGGHDEREQTLNQILTEMDGFETSESVIVMAATNRPDALDPALLRPGRFDRRSRSSRRTATGAGDPAGPHAPGRSATDVDLEPDRRATPGMTGADLAPLVNEAALFAARRERQSSSATSPTRSRRSCSAPSARS